MTAHATQIKAHPTTYDGVNFRSRLEAKWAAFFDELGWRWQYEPIDLDGWSPDFSITAQDGPVYVEVKPIEWCGEDMRGFFNQADERSDLKKVFSYSGNRPVIILGAAPIFASYPHNTTALGLLYRSRRPDAVWHQKFGRGKIVSEERTSFTIAFDADDGDERHVLKSFVHRQLPLDGVFIGKNGADRFDFADVNQGKIARLYGDNNLNTDGCWKSIHKMWKTACNRVQWRLVK